MSAPEKLEGECYGGSCDGKRFLHTADMKRVETHLKRTFNTGGIILKPRGKPNDSCEVYVGDEFIGVVFEDEDEAGSFMFEMAILAEDLPQD